MPCRPRASLACLALACAAALVVPPASLAQHGERGHAAKEEAHVYRLGLLAIEAPWTRATPGGAKVAGGYMRITNTGSAPDRLVGGSAAFAGRFELHEMATKDGIVTMRPLTAGLEIKPGATVELRPGGYHAMFLGLKAGLKEGQSVKGTLVFEKAGTVEVEYRVAPLGASSPGDGRSRGGHGEAKGHGH